MSRASMAGTRGNISTVFVARLMGLGLLTFFLPIVTTDTVVHGRTEWAPLDLLTARADLWRPAPPAPFHVHEVLYRIALLYMLMVVALVVLGVPSPRKPLTLIAIVGSAISVSLVRNGQRAFGWLFYGGFTHSRIWEGEGIVKGLLFGWQGLRFDFAYGVLLCVMPLLALAIVRQEPAVVGATETEKDERTAG